MNRNSGFGMFSKIVENANKTANNEKAKEIRTKLIRYGSIGAVIFGIMVFGGFIGFAASGMSAVQSMSDGFPFGIIVSMVFFMLGGFGLSISSLAIKAGLAIVVAGITTNVLDVNDYCPKCNDRVDDNEIFCNNCGNNLRANKLCSCGTQNNLNDKFCRSCGKSLN